MFKAGLQACHQSGLLYIFCTDRQEKSDTKDSGFENEIRTKKNFADKGYGVLVIDAQLSKTLALERFSDDLRFIAQ